MSPLRWWRTRRGPALPPPRAAHVEFGLQSLPAVDEDSIALPPLEFPAARDPALTDPSTVHIAPKRRAA